MHMTCTNGTKESCAKVGAFGMCLCGRTCVSAEAVSFHGTMQDRLELAG